MTNDEFTEEALGTLLSPDLVLPEQFFARNSLRRQSGERALQWAVLADGIETYRRFAHSRTRSGQREFAKVRAWVNQTDWHWLYSFVNLCTTFGFDPDAVREALQRSERYGEFKVERRRYRHAA